MDFFAAVLQLITGGDEGDDFVGVRGGLDVRQALGPGARRHQPEEGKHRCDHKVLKPDHTHPSTARSVKPQSINIQSHAKTKAGWALNRGYCTHNLGTLLVFPVFLQHEAVNGEGCHGVQEGEDTDGDEELSRGGVVTDQEETLGAFPLAGWGVEVHLMEPTAHTATHEYRGMNGIHLGTDTLAHVLVVVVTRKKT